MELINKWKYGNLTNAENKRLQYLDFEVSIEDDPERLKELFAEMDLLQKKMLKN
jgi:hypothetical protein